PDGRNYLLVRANALENNFRLYTMVNGRRSTVASATVTQPKLGDWHRIRVVAKGPKIQAYLDDTLLLNHEEKAFTRGWVGLWTKADSVTELRTWRSPGPSRNERRRARHGHGDSHGHRWSLERHRGFTRQARGHLLWGTSDHGHHAGRAAGEAPVGVEGALSGRALGSEHAAGRDGDPARHLPWLRARRMVGWTGRRALLRGAGVHCHAGPHDGLRVGGFHAH